MPKEELVVNFDMDAMTWSAATKKSKSEPSDPAPWNLVYHSAFKLDVHNIGVLWYDYESDLDQKRHRYLRVSILNVNKTAWKDVRLINEDEALFRLGASIYPTF